METRLGGILEARITKAVNDRSTSIVVGHCKDYPHYRFEVGYIQGLLAAVDLMKEIEREGE